MGTLGNDFKIEILIAIAIFILFIVTTVIYLIRVHNKLANTKSDNDKLKENNYELKAKMEELEGFRDELLQRNEKLIKSRDAMEKLAYIDNLTELPNRNALINMLDSIMLTIRKDEIIGIMEIDLDNFKILNDSLGASFGDELLIDVTHRLKQVLDENDYLARIGGDEFAILTQNLEDEISYEEKIKQVRKVFTYPFMLSTKECFLTVSIGVVFAPNDGKTSQTLMKNVDVAMNVAKEKGKNNYVYFESSFNDRLTERIELESDLRNALVRNEFELYYQPQIDLASQKVIGFEALIRWNHPTEGLMYPDDFIHLAEETGLIVPIGEWVIYTAFRQMKKWEDEGYNNITMAVNISTRQFTDVNFVDMVYNAVEETAVNPNNIELEITESVFLNDFKYTKDIILKITELGVKFSLDDFGTGYSSMNYLKTLPIENIKIDKSFLEAVVNDGSDQKIVQAIINLANDLNLRVIAEGVEHSEQEEFLMKSDCKLAQGFLYSKAVPEEEAEKFLRERYN